MRLSQLRKSISEATMISQNMSDFIEDAVDNIIIILNAGLHSWERTKKYHGNQVFSGEVSSDIKIRPSMPQFKTKFIRIFMEVGKYITADIVKTLENKSSIVITVPRQYFDNGEKYIHDLRDTITHELVHAFNPKAYYGVPAEKYYEKGTQDPVFKSKTDPKYKEYVTEIGELEEFIEGMAYTIASGAKGNLDRLKHVLNRKDFLRSVNPPIVNDPKLWNKFIRRTYDIWQKYFSTSS